MPALSATRGLDIYHGSDPDKYARNIELFTYSGGSAGWNQKWTFDLCVTKLSGYKTFSAFDVGDADENQSELFRSKMVAMGFTNVGTYKNKNSGGYVSAQTVKDIGQYSDIIYITGHASNYTNMWFQNSSGSTMEYLCADSSVSSSNPKIGIGAMFLSGSTTKTNSFWDKKTKWGILGQCSQFNYGSSQGAGNHWNGLNNAQIWARTLLGAGHRMHGYLGYYESAPPGAIHFDRLTKALNSMNAGFNLVTSWFQGHDTIFERTNYAMLYNNANYNDNMYNFTASQTPGTSYAIVLQRREGGTVAPVPFSSPSPSQNPNTVNFSQAVAMQGFDLQDRPLSQYQKTNINAMLSTNHFNNIHYENDGSFEFQRESGNRMEVTFNENTAIAIAKQKLNSARLLPDNNYRVSVDYLVQRTLTPESPDFGEPEIIQYNVYFYRTMNGYDVISDKDDGILISIDNDGVTQMKYRWRDIVPKPTTYNISSSALTNSKNKYSKTNVITGKVISSAYYYKDDAAMPVMVFDDDGDYTNSVFVDVFTGKVVQ